MDPDAALRWAADAMNDRDLGGVFDRLDDLRSWSASGGFGPSTDSSRIWTEAVSGWEPQNGLSWPAVDQEARR